MEFLQDLTQKAKILKVNWEVFWSNISAPCSGFQACESDFTRCVSICGCSPFKNESAIKLKHVFKDIYTLKTPRGPCRWNSCFICLKTSNGLNIEGIQQMFPSSYEKSKIYTMKVNVGPFCSMPFFWTPNQNPLERWEENSQFNFYHLAEVLVPGWMNEWMNNSLNGNFSYNFSLVSTILFCLFCKWHYLPSQDLDRLFQDEATMPKCCPHHTICPATKRPLRCPSHVPHEVTHSGGVAPLRHSERTFCSGCAIWPHEAALKFQLRGYVFIHIPFNNLFLALYFEILVWSSLQFSSVTQSCPALCDPMNRSMPGLPVHHQLPEFTQTHVRRVGDAIQPSHPVFPFSSCSQSLPTSGSFPMSQLFTWGGQSTRVSASASVLPMNTQDWSPLGWTGWYVIGSCKKMYREGPGTLHQIFPIHQTNMQFRRRQWHPTPVLLPGKSHGWRSLVSYSPWGR